MTLSLRGSITPRLTWGCGDFSCIGIKAIEHHSGFGERQDSDIAKIVSTPDVSDAVRIGLEAVRHAVHHFGSATCSCELGCQNLVCGVE